MYTQTQDRSRLQETLRDGAARVIDQVARIPADTSQPRLLRWLLVAGLLFLAWRFAKGLKTLFWTVFGLAMAFWWTGGWCGLDWDRARRPRRIRLSSRGLAG